MEQKKVIELITKRNAKGVFDIVKNKTVGVAGCGGLGSNILVSLARIGVSKFVISDFDKVEHSNLNRQYFFLKHIDMLKTDAIEDILKSINPEIVVEKHSIFLENNKFEIFKNCDVVAEAFDKAECKADITQYFLENLNQIPLVCGSGLSGFLSSNLIKTHKLKKNLYICGDLETGVNETIGVMAPRVLIAANHQANMILRLLLGETEI